MTTPKRKLAAVVADPGGQEFKTIAEPATAYGWGKNDGCR